MGGVMAVMFGFLSAWMLFQVMQSRRLARDRDHADAVLARLEDPEERVEYLALGSAWPVAKRRAMESRIGEIEQEGWTWLKATSAPFKKTIRSWGGGLYLHFVRGRQIKGEQEPGNEVA